MTELSQFLTGGGGEPLKLAPDPNFITSRLGGPQLGWSQVSIAPTGSLQTVLSLSGKYILSKLNITGMGNGANCSIKLTIDGTVIYDESNYTVNSNDAIIGGGMGNAGYGEQFIVEESLVLEYATDGTLIIPQYVIRPIM